MKTLAVLLLCLFTVGCATARPTGRKGLLEQNAAMDRVGSSASSIRRYSAVPPASAKRSLASRTATGPAAVGNHLANPTPLRHPAIEVAARSLHWPLQQVSVTSPFGKRGNEFHEGIDLKAQQGTPVLAAQDGMVIYAGSKIRGYGKLIVIRHQRQFSTIYAHNSQLLVRAGQYVHQGQKISITGKTGHVTGPHLHFEVRDGMAALNPMDFLPDLRTASETSVPATAPLAKPAAPAKRIAAASVPKTHTRSVSYSSREEQ